MSKRPRLLSARATAIDESMTNATMQASLGKLPHYSRYSQTGTEELAEGNAVYQYLSHEFHRTRTRHRGPNNGDPHRDAPEYEILRIMRVKAPRLQEKYLAEVQDMAGLCQRSVTEVEIDALHVNSFEGLDMNEFLLYHGAPSELVQSRLLMQGLDPRYAGDHFGKLFGAGIYLASNSSKSDIYTEPNAAGERCVLVVRACLGETHQGQEPCRTALRPPERPDGRGALSSFAAVTLADGGCVEHPEYIVYKETETLVEYAIWYRHSSRCRCTHCIELREEEEASAAAAGDRFRRLSFSLSGNSLSVAIDAAIVRLAKRGHATTAGVQAVHTSLDQFIEYVQEQLPGQGVKLREIKKRISKSSFIASTSNVPLMTPRCSSTVSCDMWLTLWLHVCCVCAVRA